MNYFHISLESLEIKKVPMRRDFFITNLKLRGLLHQHHFVGLSKAAGSHFVNVHTTCKIASIKIY